MRKTTKKKVVKKTPATLIKSLTKYVGVNGVAKTAVALEMRDVNSIRNWLTRKEIPTTKRDLVRDLKNVGVQTYRNDVKVVA